MIKENRVYKTKSGKFVKVQKITSTSVHGIYLDEDCTEKGGFTSTYENFKNVVSSKPMMIENFVIVSGEEIPAKSSKVLYSHVVVCESKESGKCAISTRSTGEETANSSMARAVAETQKMGWGGRYRFFVTTMNHRLVTKR